jgi:CYTH domain-containing protein
MENNELEKRYELIGKIPMDLVKLKKYIEQTYSSIADVKTGTPDCRIRKTEQDGEFAFIHTVKYKTDDKNSRIELEQDISEDTYNQIFDLIGKKPVRKNRYIVPLDDGLIAEIDEFLDKDINIIEVEFPDEKTMDEFSKLDKPSFIGKEITKQQSFSAMIFSSINQDVKIKFY